MMEAHMMVSTIRAREEFFTHYEWDKKSMMYFDIYFGVYVEVFYCMI